MTWRYQVIKDLIRIGFRGRLINFIQNFLSNRTITTRVGDQMLSVAILENELPHGSILSPTLFLIAINNIVKSIHEPIVYYLYADDLAIFLRTKSVLFAQTILQRLLNKLEKITDSFLQQTKPLV